MKHHLNFTKEELLEAILYFAKKINKYGIYKARIETNIRLPDLIMYLVYDKFISDYTISMDEYYWEHHNRIYTYANTLEKIGYINFKD